MLPEPRYLCQTGRDVERYLCLAPRERDSAQTFRSSTDPSGASAKYRPVRSRRRRLKVPFEFVLVRFARSHPPWTR